MQVNIIRSEHDQTLANFIDQHVRLAVNQFASRVSSIDVRIVEIHGGPDQRCTLQAQLMPRGQVQAEAVRDNAHAAIMQAARRLSTAVSKHVERGHQAKSIRHKRRNQEDLPSSEISH